MINNLFQSEIGLIVAVAVGAAVALAAFDTVETLSSLLQPVKTEVVMSKASSKQKTDFLFLRPIFTSAEPFGS